MQKPKTTINVLSLDGGGIRGLIPLRFLHALEYSTGKKVHDIFHTIVGTSTGGLITALVSLPSQVTKDKGPVSAKKALEIYQGLGPEIFPKAPFNFKHYAFFLLLSLVAAGYIWIQARLLRLGLPPGEQTHSKLLELYPWMWILVIVFLLCLNLAGFFGTKIKDGISKAKYSGGTIVKFCRGHFVEGTKLKDAKITIGICATDIKKRRSFVFNSMRSEIYHDCALHGAEIAQIARATSAAPTYFNPEFFVIVPKDGQEVKPHHKKESDLKPEMTPWDSRDEETVYDRRTVAFEDGGTKMNNPSKAAIKLAQMQLKREGKNPDDYEIRLLSVGTGSKKGKQEDPTLTYHTGLLHKLSKIGFLKFLDDLTHENWKAGIWGVFQRRLMGDVFEVLINAHNDHLEVQQHFKESNMEQNYRRQQFKITEKQLDGMDDTSKENMESLVKSANRMILNKKSRGEWSDDFKKCVEFLGLPIVNQPDSEWEMKEDDFEDESESESETETKEEKKNK